MTVRRKLGEAITVHERNVESAIGRVPQWRSREASYIPLVGGLMNQNWLVEVAGDPRRYFIKVPGEGSEMFIDRVAANAARPNDVTCGVKSGGTFVYVTGWSPVSSTYSRMRLWLTAVFAHSVSRGMPRYVASASTPRR